MDSNEGWADLDVIPVEPANSLEAVQVKYDAIRSLLQWIGNDTNLGYCRIWEDHAYTNVQEGVGRARLLMEDDWLVRLGPKFIIVLRPFEFRDLMLL